MSNQEPSHPGIAAVRLSHLRGFADEVGITFSDPAGARCSLVLLGENGAGKSSVADAIEFGLRGVVSRRSVGGAKQRRELRNLLNPTRAPHVEIDFTDGTGIARGKKSASGANLHVGQGPVTGFEVCPVVIRRRDIDGFWLVPDNLRREFFFDYLREPRGAFLNAERRLQAEQDARAFASDLIAARKNFEEMTGWKPKSWPQKLPTWRKFRPQAQAAGRRAKVQERMLRTRLDELERLLERRNWSAGNAARANEHDWSAEAAKVEEVLRAVGVRVARDFVEITSLPVTDLGFGIDGSSGLEIGIKFDSGPARAPQEILSEAQLDLLAVLVLIEVHIECSLRGQTRFLALDDVFQSVDRELRAKAIDHIAERLADWQLLVTVHDKLWAEVVRRALVEAGHQVSQGELRATSFGSSPTFIKPRSGLLADAEAALAGNGSPALVVGAAGRALEAALELSTQALGTRLQRKEGDRYTINDLWVPMADDLKSCTTSGIQESVLRVEAKRYLRNVIGAHFNEAADTFTIAESMEFMTIVQTLVGALFCPECGRARRRQKSSGTEWALVADPRCKHPSPA